jgi:hypothetical protein
MATKNRGPHLAHGSWRLLGGPAASASARREHRSPIDTAQLWRRRQAREGADEEMHGYRLDPR